MTEANYIAYTPACACGAPLKIFKSTGQPAKVCGNRSCYPRYERKKFGESKPQRPTRTCADCGKSVWRGSTRCSECYKRAVEIPMARCNGCGVEFRPTKSAENKYCSRDCAFAHKASPNRKQNLILAAERRRQRKADAIGWNIKIWFKNCSICSIAFTAHRPRSHRCEECATKKKSVLTSKLCTSCGEQFETAIESKRYCSMGCRPDRLLKHARQRARKAGVAYEPVNAIRVFNRDGWRCQICGRRTPISRRGTNHSNAPELDHRVPMSKGGPHSYENTQCACRECNGLKSNKSQVGQMPLFCA